MTLADVQLPVTYEWASGCSLVFPAELADRLLEVQDEVGDSRYRLVPTPTVDGRFLCRAELLTECVSGFLAPAFARLNAGNFDQVDVVAWAEAVALLPAEPSPV
jgi:hypothetical protein